MSENLLFACAHCFKRFSFDDLTGDNHYCESCYRATLRRCCNCRRNFSPENNIQNACGTCNNSIVKYGTPRSCKVCKLKAAFKGRKCKRCYRYCVKYGMPRKCSQCKYRAAFVKNRSDLQFNAKLICWLCAHDIKRSPSEYNTTNDKKTNKNSNKNKTERLDLLLSPLLDALATASNTPSSSTSLSPSPLLSTQTQLSPFLTLPSLLSLSPGAEEATATAIAAATVTQEKQPTPTTSPSVEIVCANDDVNEANTNPANTPEALASIDMTLELPEIIPKSLMINPFSSEHLIAMTELKDTVAALEKRVYIQNKQLMEKDKLLNTMRAEMQDKENRLRQQLREMNNCHLNELENLNCKVFALTKENITLKKAMKENMKKTNNLKKPNDGFFI